MEWTRMFIQILRVYPGGFWRGGAYTGLNVSVAKKKHLRKRVDYGSFKWKKTRVEYYIQKGGSPMNNMTEALAHRRKEEELLRFSSFSNEDALTLGLKIVEKAKQRGAAVAIDIEVNGNQLFHYAMPGSNKRHALWIRRKQNMVQTTLISSLHAYQQLINEGKDQWKDWRLNEADYGAIGGGFPIHVIGTGIVGAVACSALPHEEDHRLLVDSISEMIGVSLDEA